MRKIILAFVFFLSLPAFFGPAKACTHITLKGTDGTIVSARTLEWETFDLNMNFTVIPRNTQFTSFPMPDKKAGISWKGKYGMVGNDILNLTLADVMNEKGLTVLMLYFPGTAEYQVYDPDKSAESITAANFVQWVGSQFATVDQVRKALNSIRVVTFSHPAVGGQVDMHWAIADPSGDQIVVEYTNGKLQVYDSNLGVMTNSPSYDWHLTNLRNYINMRPVAWPDMEIADMVLKPIGMGTGMLGLPGDITPPSRFVRAVAFTQSARKTTGAYDTVRETFRILDNFNVPAEAVNPEDLKAAGLDPIRFSGTQYTSAYDMKNLILYYHTDNNRTVRRVDLKAIDFVSLKNSVVTPMRGNDDGVVDVTPRQ